MQNTRRTPHRLPLLLALSCALWLVAGCQQSTPPVEGRIARVESSLVPRKPNAPKHALSERMAFYKVAGLSIAVVNEGKVEWAKGYGTMEPGGGRAVDTRTLFHGCSLSKVVNAITILKLVGDGTLDLGEDVNAKLTSWKIPQEKLNAGHKTTLYEILSHTAGFNLAIFGRGYDIAQPRPTLLDTLDGKTPATNPAIRIIYPPGARYHYSGGGIAVTQQLLLDVTHEQYEQLVQETVFDPLGMTNSTFDQPLPKEWEARASSGFTGVKRVNGPDRYYPAMSGAGIWSTPSDMAKVILEIQRTVAGNPGKVLRPAETRLMLTGRANYVGSRVPAEVGLGTMLSGDGDGATFFHAGSHAGYNCYLIGSVRTGKGVVIMTNSDKAFALIGEVITAVAKEYGWKDYEYIPPPPAPATQPATVPATMP